MQVQRIRTRLPRALLDGIITDYDDVLALGRTMHREAKKGKWARETLMYVAPHAVAIQAPQGKRSACIVTSKRVALLQLTVADEEVRKVWGYKFAQQQAVKQSGQRVTVVFQKVGYTKYRIQNKDFQSAETVLCDSKEVAKELVTALTTEFSMHTFKDRMRATAGTTSVLEVVNEPPGETPRGHRTTEIPRSHRTTEPSRNHNHKSCDLDLPFLDAGSATSSGRFKSPSAPVVSIVEIHTMAPPFNPNPSPTPDHHLALSQTKICQADNGPLPPSPASVVGVLLMQRLVTSFTPPHHP